MHRTTVMMPHSLRLRSLRCARERGISLGELVRRSLESYLKAGGRPRSQDPLFDFSIVYKGKTPRDLSVNHDKYLYDEDA